MDIPRRNRVNPESTPLVPFKIVAIVLFADKNDQAQMIGPMLTVITTMSEGQVPEFITEQ